MAVGLVYDPVYLEHETGTHVENIQRLTSTLALLEENHLKDKLHILRPRPATLEELSKIHAPEYIAQIKRYSEQGGGYIHADTAMSKDSYNAALYAAGGVITAVDAVISKRVDSAFALVRPPGHHATCWQAMGFCIFNNVAVAAKYALSNFNLERILIVDFDVHHGNGTQDAFYADQHVLYFSTHEYPLYPGTGGIDETGVREGEGYTVNIPMLAGWGDDEYQTVFEDILAPIAKRFQPQLILVSAGYDAHWADHLAMMEMSILGFARLTEILKTLANVLCQGRLVFALEGGYHLEALSYSISATLNILLGNNEISDPLGRKGAHRRLVSFDKFIGMVKEIHHNWF